MLFEFSRNLDGSDNKYEVENRKLSIKITYNDKLQELHYSSPETHCSFKIISGDGTTMLNPKSEIKNYVEVQNIMLEAFKLLQFPRDSRFLLTPKLNAMVYGK